MSHFKERQEKICLNCNASLQGTYCHICGQENIEPKESVWHLLMHFFYDITHFDGKFFSTLRLLVFRPGFLPAEYSRGRRASYLNPIRMYVFTSAFFFLIFFTFIKPDDIIVVNDNAGKQTTAQVISNLEGRKNRLSKSLQKKKDSVTIRVIEKTINELSASIDSIRLDSTSISRVQSRDAFSTSWSDKYANQFQYDSIQQTLPVSKRDGYIKRVLNRRILSLNDRFSREGTGIFKILGDKFIHTLPQLFFISLPIFALLLKLLYYRRKQFYYVNHIIFTLHFYIFSFIALLVIFSISKINAWLHWGLLGFLGGLISWGVLFYLYKAMRNFYGQRRAKTILKFAILNFSFMIVLVLLFCIFLFYSLLQL